MAKIRITWNVRGAVKLYDSFTARPANLSSLRIFTDEGIWVLRKPEGVLVFAEDKKRAEKKPVKVRLESPIFLPESLILPPDAPADLSCLWMRPGGRYPAPASATKLYGEAEPGARLGFVFRSEASEMKLLSGLKKDSQTVEIYHPGKRSLEGRFVEAEWKDTRIWMKIGKCMANPRPETGIYAFSFAGETEGREYPRLETKLLLGFVSEADQEGSYLFFFREVPGSCPFGRLYLQEGQTKSQKEVQLIPGGSVKVE